MTDKAANRLDIRVEHPKGTRLGRFEEHEFLGDSPTGDDLDLIERVRDRLEIGDVSDVTIAASLAQIAARPDLRGRWLAAFGSPLGKHLAQRGSDLNTALNVLLALAPKQTT